MFDVLQPCFAPCISETTTIQRKQKQEMIHGAVVFNVQIKVQLDSWFTLHKAEVKEQIVQPENIYCNGTVFVCNHGLDNLRLIFKNTCVTTVIFIMEQTDKVICEMCLFAKNIATHVTLVFYKTLSDDDPLWKYQDNGEHFTNTLSKRIYGDYSHLFSGLTKCLTKW